MSDNVYTALFKLQGTLRGVKRDAANSHFRNRYATLEAVTDTIRQPMQECGLLWLQSGGSIVDGSIEVTTRIHHPESNTWHESTMAMPLGKRDPQGAGSALTYAMRYSLMAILGLPPTDDDAETAIDRNNDRPPVDDTPPKSNAQLKREGSWEAITSRLYEELVDVKTLVALEAIKAAYRALVSKEGWNKTYTAQLAQIFEDKAEEIRQQMEKEAA